jgi:hypothetical protein
MTLGQNFPVSDYYRDQILDARTISRGGGWWTAVLLMQDPVSKKPFLAVYRWRHNGETWKLRKSISFKNKKQVEDIIGILNDFKGQLENGVESSQDEET